MSIKDHATSTFKNNSQIGSAVLSAESSYSVLKVAIIWLADAHTNFAMFVWIFGINSITNAVKWSITLPCSYNTTDTCIILLTKRYSKIALKMQANHPCNHNDYLSAHSNRHRSLDLLNLLCIRCSYYSSYQSFLFSWSPMHWE